MVIKRVEDRIRNNLGIIRVDENYKYSKTYRDEKLKKYEDYYRSKQFDHLTDWNTAVDSTAFIKVRDRKPYVIYPLGKIIVDRVSSKLVGRNAFPKFVISEDPQTTELLRMIHKHTFFKTVMTKACKDFLVYGSSFIRIKVSNGELSAQCYNPNHCYPKFDTEGALESIEIRYVYPKIEKGKTVKYWYKLTLDKTTDILFDNPKYEAGKIPIFKEVDKNVHNLNMIQGEWVKSVKDDMKTDGDSILNDTQHFAESLSYLLTLSDSGAIYGIDPQLVFSGMDTAELDDLVKTKEKAWTLGREGNASFLETSGAGVKTAAEVEDLIIKRVQDVSRIIMHDPEKFVSHAQSGRALEILNEPMVDLVEELRPFLERFMSELTLKMLGMLVFYSRKGEITTLALNPTYSPASLDITVNWSPVYQLTTEDKQKIVNLYSALTNANIMSRQTAREKMAALFDIENLEEEHRRVNTQKEFNSFGGF